MPTLSMLIARTRLAWRQLPPVSIRHLIYDAGPVSWLAGSWAPELPPGDGLPAGQHPEPLPAADQSRYADNHRLTYQAAAVPR
jgi:hypothetical protein